MKTEKEFKVKVDQFEIRRNPNDWNTLFDTGKICNAIRYLISNGYIILAHSLVVNNLNPPDMPKQKIRAFIKAFKKPRNLKIGYRFNCFDGLKRKEFFNLVHCIHHNSNFLDDELISKIYGKEFILDGTYHETYLSKPIIKTGNYSKIKFKEKNLKKSNFEEKKE